MIRSLKRTLAAERKTSENASPMPMHSLEQSASHHTAEDLVEGGTRPQDLAKATTAKCLDLLRTEFDAQGGRIINERTRTAYERMLRELERKSDTYGLEENARYLEKTIRDAKRYFVEFRSTLERGVKEGWLSKEGEKEWMERFFDPTTLELQRKSWLKDHFKEYTENWKNVANRGRKVLKRAQELKIDSTALPELKKLERWDTFLNDHYDKRVDHVEKLEALLDALEKGCEAKIREIERYLTKLSVGKDRCLHPSKVGKLMRRAMDECSTPEECDTFMEQILLPYTKDWKSDAESFRSLEQQMAEHGVPRGFNPLTEDEFLIKDYPGRLAYLNEAQSRMETPEEADDNIANFKSEITHAIDTQDWKFAAEALAKAQAIADPNDRDLFSMAVTIAPHLKDDDEKKDNGPVARLLEAVTLLTEIRELVDELHPSVRGLYLKVLEYNDPLALTRLCQLMYNRVWVRENVPTVNDETERQNKASAKNLADTREHMEKGHERGRTEHNVIKDGDTASIDAIADDPTKPQTIYMENGEEKSDSVTAVAKKIFLRKEDPKKFGYWTTLIPGHGKDTLEYSEHRHIVKNINWKLKTKFRRLHELQFAFTPAGGVEPLSPSLVDTPSVERAHKPPPSKIRANETSHSTAA